MFPSPIPRSSTKRSRRPSADLSCGGAKLPLERAKVIRRMATLIRERADEIAATITLEQGKPLSEGRAEAHATADLAEWLAEETRRIYGRIVPSRFESSRVLVTHEPVGPVAAFSPWNFPCMMPARKIVHALAAGCSIILKPAEETPGTAVLLGQFCKAAGVPDGVVGIVFGVPSQVSEYLIASPTIKKVSLTGSVPVGKRIAELAARGLKRVTLELGGHSPVIVFEDADLERAAELCVRSRFRNAGSSVHGTDTVFRAGRCGGPIYCTVCRGSPIYCRRQWQRPGHANGTARE